MRPDVLGSVIIPTDHRVVKACETIDHIFTQTYSNIEIVVVNDD